MRYANMLNSSSKISCSDYLAVRDVPEGIPNQDSQDLQSWKSLFVSIANALYSLFDMRYANMSNSSNKTKT